MATIAQTSMRQNGPVTVTTTASTASDTLTYVPNTFQVLAVRNTTGGNLDVTIDGSGSTTISPDGYGGTISVAAGKTFTVPANGTVLVNLDSIKAFLSGTIAITNTGTAGQLVYTLLAL